MKRKKAPLREGMKELTFKVAIRTYTKGKRYHHIAIDCMKLEYVLGKI